MLVLIVAWACLPGLCVSQAQPASSRHQQDPLPPEQRIDINHASVEELLKVPGMTRPWAQRIVRFRPYRTKQDLIDQGVMPGDVYNRIKDYVIAHQDKK
jgi:DNA uptake protein ComE-like DNA-binding protein